jgi:uncharacterized membrane protein YdbT with pleckstrin-like domain
MRELHGAALVDRAWRGYNVRAAIPWLCFGVAVDIFVLVGRWSLDDLSSSAHRIAAIGAYVAALVGSSLLVTALLYRAVTYTYRLTDRAVLIDKGYFSLYQPPIWLDEIAEVATRASWIGERLGIGRVFITTAAGQTIRMTGVRDPQEFARLIREEIVRHRGESKAAESPQPPAGPA